MMPLILIIIVFYGYVGFIWHKYGILPAISNSYYKLPDKINILFSLFCLFTGILSMTLNPTYLMVISGSFLGFVGAASSYKQSLTDKVHNISAGVAIILSQLSILLDLGYWQINVSFLLLSLLFYKILKNYLWWIEILAFTSLILALWINLL